MKLMSLGILAVLLAACTSTSPRNAEVQVTRDADGVGACQPLGAVEANSGWGGQTDTLLASPNTVKVLQNKTAKLGGNVVLVITAGAHAKGEAYKCPAAPSQP